MRKGHRFIDRKIINLFASEAVYTRNFFLTACRTACKHAFRFFESFSGSRVNTPLVAVTNVR